jgi:hypothetical protein
MMIVPMYVKGAQIDELTQEINYSAITGADEVQNNLDEGTSTNFDSWDPVPSGVWYGGWAIESQLRLSVVPDDDFSIALATVCSFGSEIIMSGAARTIVRLPIFTSGDPWTRAILNIYEIDETTNWTFQRDPHFNQLGDPAGDHHLNDMKINFSGSNHELIFWSKNYSPTDISPTDGDDHYTRTNRTYAIVDAPIKPDTYYLFVTYVWFASDKYVEIFLQPDSLTNGAWNASTIATYNEDAPDSFQLQISNLSVSLGYSFDFRNGFGNSAYGLDLYMYGGDDISFNSYIDPDTIDDSHYLSFMLPYRSILDNISWDGSIYIIRDDSHGFVEVFAFSDYITNDFILISMVDIWSNNVTGQFNGWFRISLEIQNDTRIYFPLWDIPTATGDQRMGLDWFTNSSGDQFNNIWETNDRFNYNPMQYISVVRTAGGDYTYHWMIQHSIQFNNYYWTKSVANSGGTEVLDQNDNMTLTQKVIFGFGSILIRMGDVTTTISQPLGTTLRAFGTAAQIVAQYADFPDPVGWVWDKIQYLAGLIQTIGQWIWRAVQEVVGIIRWFVEQVTYYASIILGLLILLVAFMVFFLPVYISAKIALMIVKAAKGDVYGVVDDLGNMAGKASNIARGRG